MSTKTPKRDCNISLKATQWQRDEIHRRAAKCGMNVSLYLLTLGLGYEPHQALTDEERRLLEPLQNFRSDINRFFGQIKGYSAAQRSRFLSSFSNVAEWLKLLVEAADRLAGFLDRVTNNQPKLPHTASEATDKQK